VTTNPNCPMCRLDARACNHGLLEWPLDPAERARIVRAAQQSPFSFEEIARAYIEERDAAVRAGRAPIEIETWCRVRYGVGLPLR
jgi:hypothetical protein